jgi:site-specific DNA-adenine methylase
VSVVVIGAISYVVYDYNQDVINAKIERKKERAERHRASTLERLNKAIKNGNNYFESGKWELAVDQYYKAYRIQPENISLYYRLTESMVFCCRDLNAYCDNASMFIRGFEDTFPDESVKIKKLKNYQAEIKG